MWRRTHSEELTTPAFVLHVSSYVMFKEGVTPSSPEGSLIKETVESFARARLNLRVRLGDHYGVQPHQAASEPGTTLQEDDSVPVRRTDRLPPSERLLAINHALEPYEDFTMPGTELRFPQAYIPFLHPLSCIPWKETQKSPTWYADLRTMAPDSVGFTRGCPVTNDADNYHVAQLYLPRSEVIPNHSTGMSDGEHYRLSKNIRPERDNELAHFLPEHIYHRQAQQRSSPRGQGKDQLTLLRDMNKKASRIAGHQLAQTIRSLMCTRWSFLLSPGDRDRARLGGWVQPGRGPGPRSGAVPLMCRGNRAGGYHLPGAMNSPCLTTCLGSACVF